MPNAVVLVAEDDVALIDLMAVALERQFDVRVAIARDGLQTLRQAKSLHPDVIVLDADLPGLDTAHLIRMLKAQQPTKAIPVVAVNRNGKPIDDNIVGHCDAAIAQALNAETFTNVIRRHLPREKAYERSYYAEWQLAPSV